MKNPISLTFLEIISYNLVVMFFWSILRNQFSRIWNFLEIVDHYVIFRNGLQPRKTNWILKSETFESLGLTSRQKNSMYQAIILKSVEVGFSYWKFRCWVIWNLILYAQCYCMYFLIFSNVIFSARKILFESVKSSWWLRFPS